MKRVQATKKSKTASAWNGKSKNGAASRSKATSSRGKVKNTRSMRGSTASPMGVSTTRNSQRKPRGTQSDRLDELNGRDYNEQNLFPRRSRQSATEQRQREQ